MSLLPIAGHRELRARFRAAAASGRFPQSLLLHGPRGVGKQRLALWTAALLLCEEEEPPCGRCRGCRLADRLQHPDIHWHFPLPHPGSDERARARLEASRQEELAARRAEPLRVPNEEAPTGIYLPAVQEMRAAAVRRPAIGRCTVFVVGEAERMVSQASSPEAANAFLKLLEEPPSDTFLLLTSGRPAALLPTIRSRVVDARVPPLREEEVEAFLHEHAGVTAPEAKRLAALSGGAIGRALRVAAEPGEEAGGDGRDLLAAALSGRRADRLRLALALGARGARGPFRASLEELAGLLRELLKAVAEGRDLPGELRRRVGASRLSVNGLLEACRRVEEALAEAEGNVNPQAIAAVLLADLAATLDGNQPGSDGY